VWLPLSLAEQAKELLDANLKGWFNTLQALDFKYLNPVFDPYDTTAWEEYYRVLSRLALDAQLLVLEADTGLYGVDINYKLNLVDIESALRPLTINDFAITCRREQGYIDARSSTNNRFNIYSLVW